MWVLIAFLCNLISIRHLAKFAVLIWLILFMPKVVDVSNDWYVVEIMFWGGARDRPLDGSAIPWVRWLLWNCPSFITEPSPDNVHSENNHPDQDHKSANCHNSVPKVKAVFGPVPTVSTRHPLKPNYMHWTKGHIKAHEQNPEMPFPQRLIEFVAKRLWPPVVHPSKEAHQCAAKQYVMEVGDDEVGVSLLCICRCYGMHYAGKSTNSEHRNQRD